MSKKLVQLKNINNENIDPINLNYETRITNLENNVYSTNEVKTKEKWTNGKSIYRKTYTGTTPTLTGSWQTIAITGLSSVMDELVKIEGMCGTGNLPRYSDGGYYIDIQVTSKNYINVMGKGYSNQPFKVTLYYTKN